MQQRTEAPLGKRLQQHLAVTGRVEIVPSRRQFELQFLEIVNLPIVGQHKSAIARFHRLARRVGQIDDRKPPVTEPDRAIAIMALAVRTSMSNDVRHRRQRRDRSRSPVTMENTGYAAH